ncbi:hypothetical protein WJS89_01565 [Sphingomicrobium sp. XHP0235]|uniref:hypothetical protein n=1 Tax=Sphingomicrobium aquimarinum TaxID=3133971 RepID=UPI0031FF388B
MDPFSMVVAIVLIATIGGVVKENAKTRQRIRENVPDDGEMKMLRDEVVKLRDRVQVLERIAVEKEDTLTRQIEELRDR